MANGPRVFYCKVALPPGERAPWLLGRGERKISARGPKSAAEAFIVVDYPEAMKYKPGVVWIEVRETGGGPVRTFAISTTVTAREVRNPNPALDRPET